MASSSAPDSTFQPSDASAVSTGAELEIYQDKMVRKYEEFMVSFPDNRRPPRDPYARWLKFACLYPKFALPIEEIRELLYEIEEGGDETPRSQRTPLQYMDFFHAKIIPRWDKYLQRWPQAINASPSAPKYARDQIELLREKVISIGKHVDSLAKEPIPDPDGLSKNYDRKVWHILSSRIPAIDLRDAIRAVYRPYNRLRRIEPELRKTCDDAETSLAERTEISGLQRRRIRQDPGADGSDGRGTDRSSMEVEGRNHNEVDSNPADRLRSPPPIYVSKFNSILMAVESQFSWLKISQYKLRHTWLWRDVTQSTLWILAIATGILSAIVVTVSAAQSRPAECIPSFNSPDDSTWALVAQVPVQLFSLYTTMLPIIKDKSLSVRPFWFVAGLSLSAVMTVLSPIVYGVSWRSSTYLTYFASVFAMTCSTQLAGSIMDGLSSQELVQ